MPAGATRPEPLTRSVCPASQQAKNRREDTTAQPDVGQTFPELTHMGQQAKNRIEDTYCSGLTSDKPFAELLLVQHANF